MTGKHNALFRPLLLKAGEKPGLESEKPRWPSQSRWAGLAWLFEALYELTTQRYPRDRSTLSS